jgi:hypothetical protein
MQEAVNLLKIKGSVFQRHPPPTFACGVLAHAAEMKMQEQSRQLVENKWSRFRQHTQCPTLPVGT